MKTKGQFTYKGISHVDAGTFVNAQGQSVDYKGSYKLQVDEITPEGIYERKIKIEEEKLGLVQELMKLGAYDVIELEFDVTMYSSGARLSPTGFKVLHKAQVNN